MARERCRSVRPPAHRPAPRDLHPYRAAATGSASEVVGASTTMGSSGTISIVEGPSGTEVPLNWLGASTVVGAVVPQAIWPTWTVLTLPAATARRPVSLPA